MFFLKLTILIDDFLYVDLEPGEALDLLAFDVQRDPA